MGRVLKDWKCFVPAIILSFVVGFDCFIYEPVTMYANNTDDFWFDFYGLIKPSLLFFFVAFILMMCFFMVIWFFARKANRLTIYYALVTICSFCFMCAYIHSNFLTSFLPSLDGSLIDWSDVVANVVSVSICLILLVALIIGLIKLEPQKVAKYCTFIVSAIFIMLAVSFSSVLITTDALKTKAIIPIATTKNLDLASSEENYYVFLVDAVDSTHFNKVVKGNEEYERALKDFSYYPDTLSGYSFTRDSIPFIFSGVWNENEKSFPEYSTEAFDNSRFFNLLSKKDFNKNFYEYSFSWGSEKALEFDNLVALEKNPKLGALLKQEIRYYLFKALPFPLKKYTKIENLSFLSAQPVQEEEVFYWDNTVFYNDYLKLPVNKTDQKYFSFIHLEGGHTPFDLNKNVEKISEEEGTYEEKLEATMKIIMAYLTKLKDNNVYDNANIVILADHGFWHGDTNRANPILYVKGKNETHDKMLTSKKQVSYADLSDMFIELLDGKDSTEVFSNIPTEGRVRRYIDNLFNHEEHMVEYEQTDKAWNTKTLLPTGEEYDL